MTSEKFNEIVEARIKKCLEILCRKAREYSRDNDRLSNFKRAALFEDEEPEIALRGMLTKHIVSVYDIVDDVEFEGILPSKELLGEKITDCINYLMLLEGLIEERREEDEDD
jgi:hypothetical protein